MKYLCLAYYDVARYQALPKADFAAIVAQCPRHDEELRASGCLVLHGSLAEPPSSIGVRPRAGKAAITDGPYTETKEQVGGFFMIEAADLNEAIRIASKHPAAHLGEAIGWGIEIRPVEYFQQFIDGRA